MKSKMSFLSLIAFGFAIAAATAFAPPSPTPWGSAPGISCTTGTIVGSDNCEVQTGVQCQVNIGSLGGPVDAFASGNCGNDDYRLKRTM
jgi:hypothetical protein